MDLFVRSPKPVEADLAFLRKNGIDSNVSPRETPLYTEPLGPIGMEALHIPIPDRKAPTPEQFDLFLGHVAAKLPDRHTVVAQCWGGTAEWEP